MKSTDKEQQLRQDLKAAVASHLDYYVTMPAVSLVDQDLAAQDDIASILMLHSILQDRVLPDGAAGLDHYLLRTAQSNTDSGESFSEILDRLLAEDDSVKSRTLFFSYVHPLANWIAISILSASYISAFILARSLLELLVSVATPAKEGMSSRISSIRILWPDERETIRDCWQDLCGWSHPHGRWLKEICPVLASKGPIHDPRLTREATVRLGICTDFALVIGFERFALSRSEIKDACSDYHIDYKRFMMLRRRIEGSIAPPETGDTNKSANSATE